MCSSHQENLPSKFLSRNVSVHLKGHKLYSPETEEQPPSPVLSSKKKRQSIDISDDNTADTDLSEHEDENAGSAFKGKFNQLLACLYECTVKAIALPLASDCLYECTVKAIALPLASEASVWTKCLSFTLQFFKVKGKALSGELFCMRTGPVILCYTSETVSQCHTFTAFLTTCSNIRLDEILKPY